MSTMYSDAGTMALGPVALPLSYEASNNCVLVVVTSAVSTVVLVSFVVINESLVSIVQLGDGLAKVVVVVVVVDCVVLLVTGTCRTSSGAELMGAHMHSVWFCMVITSTPFLCPLGVNSMVQK